jgi:hypothetical protein
VPREVNGALDDVVGRKSTLSVVAPMTSGHRMLGVQCWEADTLENESGLSDVISRACRIY